MGRKAKTTYPRMEVELSEDQHLFPPRRAEAVVLAAKGMSAKEIGRELGISPATVAWHLSEAQDQLHAHCRADLISQGWMHGLFRARALAFLLMAFAMMPAIRSNPRPMTGARTQLVRNSIGRKPISRIHA